MLNFTNKRLLLYLFGVELIAEAWAIWSVTHEDWLLISIKHTVRLLINVLILLTRLGLRPEFGQLWQRLHDQDWLNLTATTILLFYRYFLLSRFLELKLSLNYCSVRFNHSLSPFFFGFVTDTFGVDAQSPIHIRVLLVFEEATFLLRVAPNEVLHREGPVVVNPNIVPLRKVLQLRPPLVCLIWLSFFTQSS